MTDLVSDLIPALLFSLGGFIVGAIVGRRSRAYGLWPFS